MISYREEMIKAMNSLAEDERVVFLGQNICYPGSTMYETMLDIPDSRKKEMPVAEDMQLGICIGLALDGWLPVSVFPRMDFLMRAMDQLVNHLDKIEEMSVGRFWPKVIIRTAIGATEPLYPGAQHCQDHTEGLRKLLKHTEVIRLDIAEEIQDVYRCYHKNWKSSVVITEWAEKVRS